MPRFQDIPQFTPFSGYAVHVGWDYLPIHYARSVEHYGLNVCPDFQRGYVWKPEQKVKYIEYVLQGGQSGRHLYFNCPRWQDGGIGPGYKDGWYVLVDGKQRLDAVLGFLNNEFPIFGGNYFRDYSDRLTTIRTNFVWNVNTLKTRDECLQWYIDLNTGGTVHTAEEIAKVRALKGGHGWEKTTHDEIRVVANLDREVIRQAIAEEDAREKLRAEQSAAADLAAPKRRTRKGKR